MRLVSLLIRLYPAPFREEFGEEVAGQIRMDWERARSRGPLHGLWFSLLTGVDLIGSALAERVNPTWVGAAAPLTRRRGLAEMLNDWMNDLRYGFRALRRSPVFGIVTVLTLGLALGANAGIFSVVSTVLLDPLPFDDADRLVYIAASAPGSDLPDEFGVSAEFYVEYSEEATQLESVSTFNNFTSTLRTEDRTERVWMSQPTPSLFETLHAQPMLGRLPTMADGDGVVVISHRLWADWFGSDPAVIGRSYYVSGMMRTVIGVMGPDFWFPNERVLLWISAPLGAEPITATGRFGISLVGRLADGATEASLTSELDRLAQRLPEKFGGSPQYASMMERHHAIVRPLEDQLLGATAAPLWVLLGSVAIVLLIACANVANLFIVRAEKRQRDLAVRRAVGAGRAQLIRLQMAEAVIIAGSAGLLAVLLARLTVPLLVSAAPAEIPRIGDVAITAPTLLFTLGASILAALLCGLTPAVRASTPNLTRLRDGGRGSTRRRHRGRDLLVIAQTALALVLLIGSGLLLRSFEALRHVDPGYETDDIFTFQIAPDQPTLTDGPSFARFHMGFVRQIAAMPGVESVGLVENVPLNEGTGSRGFFTEQSLGDPEGAIQLSYTFTGGDYFRTMGIDVMRGRTFTDADLQNFGGVILSRTAAERLWPGEDPIGRRLQTEGMDIWMTVVGEVEDVLQYGFRDDPEALIYLPLVGPTPDAWAISSPAYVVKTRRAESIAPEIRAMVREVAPEAPMYRTFTMKGLASDSMARLSFTMLMLLIASGLALLLGAIGLYAVLSYVVAERTQEIGVRMALGAEARKVRAMVVAQGARVVFLGVIIGILAAAAATRTLSSLLFGVDTFDLTTFAGMAVAMLAVGLLASYVPARRASSVDPIESLRL